jgi:hypothetical protein
VSLRHAPMKSALVAALLVLLIMFGLFGGADAHAHEAGLSRGEYSATSAVVTATLTFARRDVASIPAETLARGLIVHGDDAGCPTVVESATTVEGDGMQVVVRATCPAAPRSVVVEAFFLSELPFGHRHLARAAGVDASLTLSRRTFSFVPAAHSSPRPAPLAFLGLGMQHILTGADHLVFLLGLVIVGGRLRELLVVITAFTLGHSISLALATLSLWVPSARVVEPLIALSIVYVGIENLFTPKQRWRITLPFGVVHGFGFASALRELSLPRAELPAALALFNVGVELGQIAVLALMLVLVGGAQRWTAFRAHGTRVVSVAIAIAGFGWFVVRVFARP